MPDLTITDIAADLLDRLRRSAAANHRTLNDEVLIRLKGSVRLMPADRHDLLERIRRRRDRLPAASRMHEDVDTAKRYGRA